MRPEARLQPSDGNGALDKGGAVTIDMEKLTALHDLLGDGFAPLVGSFISNARLYVAQIEAAVAAADPVQAKAIAHKLKSSAAQLGLPNLAKAAERVEKLGAVEHLAALITERERNCQALQQAVEMVSRDKTST